MSELHDAFEAYVPRLARQRFLPRNLAVAEASAETFPGCVLLADVSGFTPLLEQLSLEPSRGAELAQQTLNGIFGALVDRIQAWGGDILRFPGDAALALWPVAGGEELALAVRHAIHCALDAQAALERLEVRGTRLRLRIGVGAGTVWAARVGGVEGRWELLVRGRPFEQLADALAQAEPGRVVL
ncbi:MAG: adenylate/guanylate cyclase domain-containing protein, partial [Myxococcota bacterium]